MSGIDRVRLAPELTAVVVAVWHEIDHGDGSGVSAYFTEDASLTFGERTFRGRAQIDGVYADRAGRGPRVSRHVATNVYVTDSTATTAAAISVLCLFAQDGTPPRPVVTPALVADVADTYISDGGRWLISSRHILPQFIATDTVLAVPTE